MPPRARRRSARKTRWPRRAATRAASIPAGPAPTTATVRGSAAGTIASSSSRAAAAFTAHVIGTRWGPIAWHSDMPRHIRISSTRPSRALRGRSGSATSARTIPIMSAAPSASRLSARATSAIRPVRITGDVDDRLHRRRRLGVERWLAVPGADVGGLHAVAEPGVVAAAHAEERHVVVHRLGAASQVGDGEAALATVAVDPDADADGERRVDEGAGRGHDLAHEPHPVLDGAAPPSVRRLAYGREELVDEVAVGAVDLGGVEPGRLDPADLVGERPHQLLDLPLGERVGHRSPRRGRARRTGPSAARRWPPWRAEPEWYTCA